MTEQQDIRAHDGEFSLITANIRVSVKPELLPDRSDVKSKIYAHSYTVNIENNSSETFQLINRHWKVFSAGKQIADVKGEGVIGEQPLIHPGEVFEYQSWTMVRDDIGSMTGAFTCVSETGEFFDILVPEFPLLYIDENLHVH